MAYMARIRNRSIRSPLVTALLIAAMAHMACSVVDATPCQVTEILNNCINNICRNGCSRDAAVLAETTCFQQQGFTAFYGVDISCRVGAYSTGSIAQIRINPSTKAMQLFTSGMMTLNKGVAQQVCDTDQCSALQRSNLSPQCGTCQQILQAIFNGG